LERALTHRLEHVARFKGDAATANTAIVDAVRSVADAKGVAPAQVALAWV
jgi:aryl-alcohol dehydrogenase-like predicted oxidoreductase